MPSTKEQIIDRLQSFPEHALQEVLDFVDFVAQRQQQPVGIPGRNILHFAGVMETDELKLIAQAIEADCNRVNPDEW